MRAPGLPGSGLGWLRDEADLEQNKATGFQQGTESAVAQLMEHMIAMRKLWG